MENSKIVYVCESCRMRPESIELKYCLWLPCLKHKRSTWHWPTYLVETMADIERLQKQKTDITSKLDEIRQSKPVAPALEAIEKRPVFLEDKIQLVTTVSLSSWMGRIVKSVKKFLGKSI